MDIDVTFLFQLGLFLTTLVFLNGLLLKPLLRVIEERDQRIEGARAQAAELQKLGDADMEQYQARMRQARFKAAGERDVLKNEGREQERKLLAQVRAEITEKMNATRLSVQRAEDEARRALAEQTPLLAKQLVGKVLGREVSS